MTLSSHKGIKGCSIGLMLNAHLLCLEKKIPDMGCSQSIPLLIYTELEIKAFGLGSRIVDMALWDEPKFELSAKVCACYSVFGL